MATAHQLSLPEAVIHRDISPQQHHRRRSDRADLGDHRPRRPADRPRGAPALQHPTAILIITCDIADVAVQLAGGVGLCLHRASSRSQVPSVANS